MSEMKNSEYTDLEIAVIGMAARFPGARNIDEFWDNLKNGIESISFFSDEELEDCVFIGELVRNPHYIKAKGIIGDAKYFDASFFDFTPTEARTMDPQVRIFHECVWEALEHAGYDPFSYKGLISLFAGANPHAYWDIISLPREFVSPSEQFADAQLYDKDFMTTRIAYNFDLKGSAFTVFTACSTSLVAIQLACNSLLGGECHMALAGGVSVWVPEKMGYLYEEGMIFSADGHNRNLDEKATGSVFGDGVGVVMLKRKEDAVADGDVLHAVIKGTAINNDGKRKLGYTAPSVEGQVEVIRAALEMAEVECESISYIETHGTATPLGDAIEIEALKRVFAHVNRKKTCAIGTVKTNIGHLNSAAGVAGFIKTVLALKHRSIPPSLFFETHNSNIDLENSPFYVNTRLQQWKNDKYPLRAGVSSFGIGGTNAHVVLEEWPIAQDAERKAQSPGREYQLILLSAKTQSSLEQMTENLARYLEKNPGINLPDAAYTLQLGRKHFHRRKMLVCADRKEVLDILSSPASGKLFTSCLPAKEKTQEVIFMFPGQGAQYVNMGLGLYRSERIFREEMDRCFDIFRPIAGYDIKEILYPTHPAASEHPSQGGSKLAACSPQPAANPEKIDRTEITQPVIFMFEYALAKLLMNWGIHPTVMIGYSFGEYTAACLSGVFSLEDATRLVVLRGRLMQQMPEGAMLSVPLPADELKPLLNDKLVIAIDNGPSCVVSGRAADIDEFEKDMKKRRYLCIRVAVSHAGHSTVLNPILTEFAETLKKVELKEPQIPYISNVTAAPITSREVMDLGYWLRHLKDTVRFGEGIAGLLALPDSLFIEIGPGRDLCVLLKSFKEVSPTHRVINLVRHEKEDAPDLYYLLNKVGHLWLYGVDIDWKGFYADETRSRVPLPTYNFDRQLFEIGNSPLTSIGAPGKKSESPMKKKEDIHQWFYIPVWIRSMISRTAKIFTEPGRMRVLMFIDECGLGREIAAQLKQQGYQVVSVRAGEAFTRRNEDEYTIHPAESKDYEALFEGLTGPGMTPPLAIFHLWNVTPPSSAINEPGKIEWVEKEQDKGFYSLLSLAAAMGKQNPNHHFQVKVVTNNVQDVVGGEALCPEKATLLGPAKVLVQEYSNIDCCIIDIELPEPGGSWKPELVDRLIGEFKIKIQERMIAYRNNYRWTLTIIPREIAKPKNPAEGIKEKGVYLVTGGLGGIGLVMAEHLARKAKARLILIGRSEFPPREDWDHWLASRDPGEKTSEKIWKIRELEALGAEVLVFSADVAEFNRMQQVIQEAEQRFGKIHGVIHSAGVADGAMIVRRTREMSEKILAPKVTGTLVLDQLFKDSNLDFFIFCSSTSSLFPLGGQTAYSAANAFLNAFAVSNASRSSKNAISIIWERWKNIGIAVIAEEQHKDIWGVEMEGGILPGEGIDAFDRILANPMPQVVVCPIDLITTSREYNKIRGVPFADTYKADIRHKTIHQRPELSVEYVEPGNETEKKIAKVWQNFLGINRVGIHDNFFELGATSLGIIQVNGRLNNELGKDIPVTTIYSYPTVAMLAEFLNQAKSEDDSIEKEQCVLESIDIGQEKKKYLRMRRREVQ